MRFVPIRGHLMPFISYMVGAAFMGCVTFEPVAQSPVETLNEHPLVAILPFGFDLEITKLSAVKTMDETLSHEDEARQVAETLIAPHSDDILAKLCCRLVQSRLIASCEDDSRAFFRKRTRCCQTDPAIAAGDEGDFSCEFL